MTSWRSAAFGNELLEFVHPRAGNPRRSLCGRKDSCRHAGRSGNWSHEDFGPFHERRVVRDKHNFPAAHHASINCGSHTFSPAPFGRHIAIGVLPEMRWHWRERACDLARWGIPGRFWRILSKEQLRYGFEPRMIPGMNTPDWRLHLARDPQICHGQLCAKGTRVLVTSILDSLAEGATRDEILRSYPSLSPDHIDAAIAY